MCAKPGEAQREMLRASGFPWLYLPVPHLLLFYLPTLTKLLMRVSGRQGGIL